jgi:tetratricopeptide (TPR) repeat protein
VRRRRAASRARAGLLIAAGVLLLAPACVTPGLQQVQNDLDAIQQQLFKVQKDSAGLAGQIEALRGALPSPEASGAAPAESPAQLKLRLEGIERDLSVLKSRADDGDRRVESIARDVQAARQALDLLGRAPAAPPVSAASPGPAPGPGSQPAGGASPTAPPGPAIPAVAGSGGAPPGATAEEAYRDGEVQFEQQKYQEAIASFDRALEADPSGGRAPAAFLKKGLALLEINRTAEAVIQLQHVVTAFPRSEEARAARDRLRALGLKDR